jgi:hypothetical protein
MTGNKGGIVLQERDRHIVCEIGIMRVADREQVKRVAGFRSITRVNARLLGLTRAGFLRRFWLGTTAGGKKAIYSLSSKGAALVGVPKRGPRRRTDQLLAIDFFTMHQLAINEIYCAVKYGEKRKEASFSRWLSFDEPLRDNLPLIPDAFVEMESPESTLAAFLEVDRGTEALSVWKQKVRSYIQFAVSGDFEKQFREKRFRVLVVASSKGRLQSIRKTVAEMTDKIFWFATFDAVQQKGFFNVRWLRPRSDEPKALINETP